MKLGVIGAVVVSTTAIAAVAWIQFGRAPQPPPTFATASNAAQRLGDIAPESAPNSATAEVAATPPRTAEPRAADTAPPSFDIVRVDPDGQTVIAGRAVPNEPVDILLNNQTVDTVLADASGRFVTVVTAPPSPTPQELRLRVRLPDRARAEPPDRLAAAQAEGSVRDTAASVRELTAGPTGPVIGAASPMPEMPRVGPAAGAGSGPVSGVAIPVPALRPDADVDRPDDADRRAAAAGPPLAAAGQLLSDPVLILPQGEAGESPALVQPRDEELALLQHAGPPPDRVVLDQLTQSPDGHLMLRGRARPRHAVRVYANGREIGTVPVDDGSWSIAVPGGRAEDIRLFRMDEIGRTGEVESRIEVPFAPTDAASQVLRDRKITVQRGDNLWRIAEQNYGEGLRYSLIFGANSDLIRDPDLIYPDQVFTIPELVEAE